jgi:hypothetical protein
MFQGEYTAVLASNVLTLTPIAGRNAGPDPRPTTLTITYASAALVPAWIKGKRLEVTLAPRT